MNNVITLILAGGVGTRLFPLTSDRAKPAVPFGGQYRIIDFALSNCLHSELRQILVLPQYKSHSLMKHLRDGWSVFNPSLGE
jgi:glucose-1-phosphate adenylyltransferase